MTHLQIIEPHCHLRGSEYPDTDYMRLAKEDAEGYPKSFPVADTAIATGYSPTSGGFAGALGKLRKLELVDGRGEIKANEILIG